MHMHALSTTSLARLRSEIISGLVGLCAEGDGKIRLLFRLFVCVGFLCLYIFVDGSKTVLQGLHSFVIHSLPFEELRLAVNLYFVLAAVFVIIKC